MKGIIKEADLRYYWSEGIPLVYNGKDYLVGKMSYGEYFLEPYNPKYPQGRGERYAFTKGTRWTKKINKNTFEIGVRIN